jgi:hypothetical protein
MYFCCEHDNDRSGFVRDRTFLDQLSDYQRLKKNCASLWEDCSSENVRFNIGRITLELNFEINTSIRYILSEASCEFS